MLEWDGTYIISRAFHIWGADIAVMYIFKFFPLPTAIECRAKSNIFEMERDTKELWQYTNISSAFNSTRTSVLLHYLWTPDNMGNTSTLYIRVFNPVISLQPRPPVPCLYQQDNKLTVILMYYGSPLIRPCSSLSYFVHPAEKTPYSWGNLTFWGIGVIWIGRSAVITWIWAALPMKRVWKFQLSHAQLSFQV